MSLKRITAVSLQACVIGAFAFQPHAMARNFKTVGGNQTFGPVVLIGTAPQCKPGSGLETRKGKDLLKAIQGEWYSPQYVYSMNVQFQKGTATLTNAPKFYNVGDYIFCINAVKDGYLHGQQIFTDGNWYDIVVEVGDKDLIIEGADLTWQMVRP
ncbi:MAG: hypothetical protein ABJN26_25415 [Stappiaceae bacterium]